MNQTHIINSTDIIIYFTDTYYLYYLLICFLRRTLYWDRIVAKQFFLLDANPSFGSRLRYYWHKNFVSKLQIQSLWFDISHYQRPPNLEICYCGLNLSLRMSGKCWHKLKIFVSMMIKASLFLDRIKAWVRRIWKPSASQSVAENQHPSQHKQDQLRGSTEEQQYQCCSIECIWYFKRTVENIA